MATGTDDIVRPKDPSILTRAASGKGKTVDNKQMLSGTFLDKKELSGQEYESSSHSDSQSDTGFYHDPSGAPKRPDMDGFMGMGNPEKPLLQSRDLDFHLAAEEEELAILRRQLDAASKEEELLKKRCEADDLRRRIAEQHKTNAKLRGMPNETVPKQGRNKSSKKQTQSKKTTNLSDCSDIDIGKLRKSKVLRKTVNKELKNLGLIDDISDGSSCLSETELKTGKKGESRSENLTDRMKKPFRKSGKSSDSEFSISYESSDSTSSDSSHKKKKEKKKNKKKVRNQS